MLFSEGCSIGCSNCSEFGKTCGQNGTATLPDYARTYKYRAADAGDKHSIQEECGQAPWCAPGRAPIRSPCGVVGGSDQLDPSSGGPPNSGWVPDGMKLNQDGRTLKELSGPKTVWKAGSTVNMSWSVNANHGGEL